MVSRHRGARVPGWQKATAAVPLALLVGAWTVSLVSPTSADVESVADRPQVPVVPTTTFDGPASYTVPPDLEPADPVSNPRSDPRNQAPRSLNGIPAAALAAYQRTETLLQQADPACSLRWELVAAIGRVESDHGRYGGNVLGDDGVSTPGIYGVRLDGRDGTSLVRDTDHGSLDRDSLFDRAVGPMQFVPGTWDVVGVDGDNDGARNPQDIDDAAVATGVYLCAGAHDLATVPGMRAAVFSYNHSLAYVTLVLRVMQAYGDGDYTTVPDGVPSNQYVPPIPDRRGPERPERRRRDDHRARDDSPSPGGDQTPTTPAPPVGEAPPSPDAPPPGEQPRTDQPRDEEPTTPPGPGPSEPTPTDPTRDVTDTVTDTTDEVTDTTDDVTDTVTDTLTRAEATQQCLAQGISALDTAALAACVDDLVNG